MQQMAEKMFQSQSLELVNTACSAIGSPISNKKAARIPARTRNTIRVSGRLTDDELFINLECLTVGLSPNVLDVLVIACHSKTNRKPLPIKRKQA